MKEFKTHMDCLQYIIENIVHSKSCDIIGASKYDLIQLCLAPGKVVPYKDKQVYVHNKSILENPQTYSETVILVRVLEHLTPKEIEWVLTQYETVIAVTPDMFSTLKEMKYLEPPRYFRASYEICNPVATSYESIRFDTHKWFTGHRSLSTLPKPIQHIERVKLEGFTHYLTIHKGSPIEDNMLDIHYDFLEDQKHLKHANEFIAKRELDLIRFITQNLSLLTYEVIAFFLYNVYLFENAFGVKLFDKENVNYDHIETLLEYETLTYSKELFTKSKEFFFKQYKQLIFPRQSIITHHILENILSMDKLY